MFAWIAVLLVLPFGSIVERSRLSWHVGQWCAVRERMSVTRTGRRVCARRQVHFRDQDYGNAAKAYERALKMGLNNSIMEAVTYSDVAAAQVWNACAHAGLLMRRLYLLVLMFDHSP